MRTRDITIITITSPLPVTILTNIIALPSSPPPPRGRWCSPSPALYIGCSGARSTTCNVGVCTDIKRRAQVTTRPHPYRVPGRCRIAPVAWPLMLADLVMKHPANALSIYIVSNPNVRLHIRRRVFNRCGHVVWRHIRACDAITTKACWLTGSSPQHKPRSAISNEGVDIQCNVASFQTGGSIL